MRKYFIFKASYQKKKSIFKKKKKKSNVFLSLKNKKGSTRL